MDIKKCKDRANHQNHTCQMKIRQEFDEVKKLTKSAGYFCKVCQIQSTDPKRLCDPAKFEGQPGVLKWKT